MTDRELNSHLTSPHLLTSSLHLHARTMLALTALTILAALAQAAPCEPSSSASPTPSPTGKPPVSYTGRPIYWNYNLQKAMTVHGEIKAGAPVGLYATPIPS